MRRRFQVVAAVVAGSAMLAGIAGAASSPTVVTGGTSSRTTTSAVLDGTVNPNGSSTAYFFQWGLTTGYGDTSKPGSAGHGTRNVSVRTAAGGLTPGTTYHYRLDATNQFGTTAGRDRTFKTTGHPPPGVVTGTATQLSTTGATLTGSVNPSGGTTTYWFEYGTSTNYTVQTNHQTLASTTGAQTVLTPLQGLLAPGTVYHYRLVASHGGAAATTFGADATLMTYPTTRPRPGVSARTRPKTAQHRPYMLSTTGSITPASIPPQWGCQGTVTIRFFRGLRQVAFTLAAVQPNCTFGAQTVFQHLPRHSRAPVHLHGVVRYISTPYLATNRAGYESITLG
jgi:phosphodiesterase/alkaline phosphatase D-like protein